MLVIGKNLARYAFITETISIITVFGVLLYIVSNHLFEYKYAWQHSSRSLEPKIFISLLLGRPGRQFFIMEFLGIVY
ncbi:MAG: hypothetical protein WDN26_11195 [Chitinophagaceae bacterium]